MHPICSSAPSEAGLVALTVASDVAKQHDFPAADLQCCVICTPEVLGKLPRVMAELPLSIPSVSCSTGASLSLEVSREFFPGHWTFSGSLR